MSDPRPQFRANCGSVVPIVSLGILAIGGGILYQNALPVAFGAPLVLGPLLLLFYLRKVSRALSVELDSLPAVFEGDRLEVTVRLTNDRRGRWPVFFPIVADVFAPEFHASKVTVFPYRVMSGESVEEVYTGNCLLPRGVFKLGPTVLAISDPFGWFQFRKLIENRRQRNVLKVYPRLQPIPLTRPPGRAVSAPHEQRQLPRLGETDEFFSVREYRRGDPLRRVHWPITAHRGFPVVREYTRHSSGNLIIVMDLNWKALLGTGRGSSLEYAVKLTASLADRALRSGHRVRVVARGKRDLSVPEGRGHAHLRRILDRVIRMRPDGDTPLPELLAAVRSRLRTGDRVVFSVSPYLYASKRLQREVVLLKRLGIHQMVAIFDERSFRALRYEETASRVDDAKLMARLGALGVDTYLVSCGARLADAFKASRRDLFRVSGSAVSSGDGGRS